MWRRRSCAALSVLPANLAPPPRCLQLLAGKFPPPDEFCELYRVLDRILEWRPWRR